jgi:hypothetical protein
MSFLRSFLSITRPPHRENASVRKKYNSSPSNELKTTKSAGHSTHRKGGQINIPKMEKKRSWIPGEKGEKNSL